MIKAFVIGHPVAHSRSPLIHGHWLRELGIAGSYERIDVPPGELAGFLRGFREQGFAGGNVTVPHKEAALRLVPRLTERARLTGAVNTLSLDDEGRVGGDSTDGPGWAASLDEELGRGWREEVRTALVIGAGGAARAIVTALLETGATRIWAANRTPERAASLAELGPDVVRGLALSEVDSALAGADLLVNTTTLGMAGQPSLTLPVERLPATAIVSDIVYVPRLTPLLRAAEERRLRTVGGLGMLLHQAVPGFATWFGVVPTVSAELRTLVEADIESGA